MAWKTRNQKQHDTGLKINSIILRGDGVSVYLLAHTESAKVHLHKHWASLRWTQPAGMYLVLSSWPVTHRGLELHRDIERTQGSRATPSNNQEPECFSDTSTRSHRQSLQMGFLLHHPQFPGALKMSSRPTYYKEA